MTNISSKNSSGKSSTSAVDKKRLLEMMLKKKGLKSKKTSENNIIIARDNDDFLTLSSAQQRLWFLEEFTVDTAAYVFCNKVSLTGEVDLDALRKAYQAIIERHEIFRTSYQQQDGVPHQVIHEDIIVDIPLIDLTTYEDSDKIKEYHKIVQKESMRPFSLNAAPLMRMCIVKLTLNHYVVLQTIHHIVYDGWSLSVMYNELKELYEAFTENKESPLPALDVQYADFAYWQKENLNNSEMKNQLAFWKDTLAGDLPILELPIDKPRPRNQSYNGALHKIKFTESLSESLRVFAVNNECTLSMVMLTAFKILLYRYTGETDILVGMPVANRNQQQTENLIGFFVNSLVLRTSLDFDPSVEELLSRVRTVSSNAYSNQDLPFDRIVDAIQPDRDLSHNPIFQVMFAFQNTPDLPEKISNVKLELEVLDNDTSVFDVTLNLHDSVSGIYGYFEYCTSLFNKDTIERMQGHYQTILEGMISNPKSTINQLQLLTTEENKLLINDWNTTESSYSIEQCIHNVIEEQVHLTPNSIAICHENTKLTYTELNEKSNQLARYLVEIGVVPDQIIALCMERSVEMFIGILGIIKAGGAYLPLDPAYPSERLSYMLDDTKAAILITKSIHIKELPKHNTKLVLMDSDWSNIKKYESTNLDIEVLPDNLVYIIYTSGSTGKPKGVMVRHSNLVHSTNARIEYYEESIQRFLLLSSFSFDSSVAGIFWTLCQGGELHLPKQGVEKDIPQVAALLRKIQATHMLSLPSIYGLLLEIAEKNQLNSLKTIIVAGEACSPELAIQHENIMPQASLYNEYGPTEGTVWSTVYKLEKNLHNQIVPIGKPISNVTIFILDSVLQPVPIGIVGEIYIGGSGITQGYLNHEKMNLEKFINNPFNNDNTKLYKTGDLAKYLADGNIIFCGRTDHQVKIRGYRIELGEIETALSLHEGINDVVVIAKERTISSNSMQIEEYASDAALLLLKLSSINEVEADKLLSEIEMMSDIDVDILINKN